MWTMFLRVIISVSFSQVWHCDNIGITEGVQKYSLCQLLSKSLCKTHAMVLKTSSRFLGETDIGLSFPWRTSALGFAFHGQSTSQAIHHFFWNKLCHLESMSTYLRKATQTLLYLDFKTACSTLTLLPLLTGNVYPVFSFWSIRLEVHRHYLCFPRDNFLPHWLSLCFPIFYFTYLSVYLWPVSSAASLWLYTFEFSLWEFPKYKPKIFMTY